MSCEVEVNIELLIELVQTRNSIWDISSENDIDKNLKKKGWSEICEETKCKLSQKAAKNSLLQIAQLVAAKHCEQRIAAQ